jgi:hypothetical protein
MKRRAKRVQEGQARDRKKEGKLSGLSLRTLVPTLKKRGLGG